MHLDPHTHEDKSNSGEAVRWAMWEVLSLAPGLVRFSLLVSTVHEGAQQYTGEQGCRGSYQDSWHAQS